MADEKDFLIQTNMNLIENIKFADQKAALFIALNSAFIGGLYSAKLLILDLSSWNQIGYTLLSSFAFLPLIVGTFWAVWVIRPRGEEICRDADDGSLVIPSKIYHVYDNESKYSAAATAADATAYKREYASMIYWRAYINDKKYRFLNLSIWWSISGWGVAILFLVVNSAAPGWSNPQGATTKIVIREGANPANVQLEFEGDASKLKDLERRIHAVNP